MQRSDLSADIKVYLKINEQGRHVSGLGKGVIELCDRVERLGSLNRAAKDMGMAYSKAWRIIKNAEETLGQQLFIRKGANGSTLTEEAKALVDIFNKIEDELKSQSEQILDRVFKEYEDKGLFVSKDHSNVETRATPELIAEVRSLEHQLKRS